MRGLPGAMMIRPRPERRSTRPTSRPISELRAAVARPTLANIGEAEPQVVLHPERQLRRRGRSSCAATTTPISTSRARSIRGWSRNSRDTQTSVSEYASARGAPARRADRLRADVHGDRADRAAVGGLDRPQLRQPPGRADPPPDRRGQHRVDRQSLRPGAGAAVGGRPRPARRDLQQDDARSCARSATTSCAPAT